MDDTLASEDLIPLHDGQYTTLVLGVLDRLLEYYSRDEAQQWMVLPHPQLEGQAPISVMKLNGGPKLVNAILDRLDSDNYL